MAEPDHSGRSTALTVAGRQSPVGALLRRARPSDEAAIVALSSQFVARDLLLARSPEQISTRIGEFLLAVDGSSVLGCVGSTGGDGELLLYNLCVAPAAQYRGIGSQLVEAVARSGESHGALTLYAVSRYGGPWFLGHGFTVLVRGATPSVLGSHLVPGRGSTVYRRELHPSAPTTGR
jgi:N-acetylglutamate synthase-like GNAT family acetyltransferase